MHSNTIHNSQFLPLDPQRAVALTMNFPQHHLSIEDIKKSDNRNDCQSHCDHITTDPHGCLDCMSTMFGPTYAPFAAFINEFSEFAQTQTTMTKKQNDLLETFIADHRRQHSEKNELTTSELQHVFTYGTWSNGKRLFSTNPYHFITQRWSMMLTLVIILFLLLVRKYELIFRSSMQLACYLAVIQLLGVSLVTLSIYLGTLRDVTDPVIALIRAYSRIYGDTFHYFHVILAFGTLGTLFITAVVAYLTGMIGRSTSVIISAIVLTALGLLGSIIFASVLLFFGDRMKANLPALLTSTVRHFESDTSTNSLSYSWTLMHRRYNCCVDGIVKTGQTMAQKSLNFAILHPNWTVPASCCISGDTNCVIAPTMNNSFIDSSCIEPASNHFNQLLFIITLVHLPMIFIAMISIVCGIIFLMRLKTALYRLHVNNNELAKSLFALKSRNLAGISGDLTKNPIEKFQQTKDETQRIKSGKQHRRIPGYFPITPTILQVRKPDQNTYLHYGL